MGQLVANKPSFSPTEVSRRLNHAMKELADLCDRIDAGEDLDDLMLATHAALKEESTYYSDNVIAYEMACDAIIDQAKQLEAFAKMRRKTAEDVKERLRSGVKPTIEQFKDQLQLKGSLGTLAVRNQAPKVKYHCLLESKSVSSVVREDIIKQFAISPAYLEAVTLMRLDRKKVEADLKAGEKLPWAELVQETSLTVRKG